MDKALYIGMSGASQMMRAQTVHANNLANVSTTGFRADLAQSRAMQVFGEGMPSRVYAMTENPGTDLRSGPLDQTGNDLDVAIRGEGWLAVLAGDGSEAYTRAGDLRINTFGELLTGSELAPLLVFLVVAGLLWLMALLSFMLIIEPEGSTEGGGNALGEALRSLRLVIDDRPFRQYLVSRILLLSVALVPPFYVILVQQHLQGELSALGWLIIAGGLANSLSAPLVGKWSDHSSRNVMAAAAMLAGLVGIFTWSGIHSGHADDPHIMFIFSVFFLVSLAHGAVRLGRKVYLVDMANADNRAQYVAVSNTVIGIAMLFGGAAGILADIYNVQAVILLLSLVAVISAVYTLRLADVSG